MPRRWPACSGRAACSAWPRPPAGAVSFDAVDWRGPVACFVGGEGAGLPEALLQMADRRVRIPMAEPVESLNVAVSAGLLLYEARRQRTRLAATSATSG